MRILTITVAALIAFGMQARAEQAPDALIVTGPNFLQTQIGKLPITINGTQTTLAAAITSSGGLPQIPTLSFLGNSSGGTATAAAVPIDNSTLIVSGGTFQVGTGTSGATIPLLNGNNTWSGTAAFTSHNVSGASFSLTGGTIDGMTVGVTTPASGNFTALSTNGVGFITAGSTFNNQVVLKPGATGVSPIIQAQGIDANLDLQLIPKGTGVIRTYTGSVLRAYHLSERADLNGGTVWSAGNSAEGVSNFFNAGGVSGTTAAGDASINYFAIASDSLDCHLSAGGLCSGLEVNYNFGGAAARGSRTGIGSILNLTTGTGGVGGSYVAGQFTMQANVNDGGISGTEHSSVFGINAVAALTSSAATFFSQLVGSEIDVYGVTGSSVKDKIGEQIVQTSVDTVVPTRDNVAFSINNQSGAPGWQYGLEIGRSGGNFPVASTGTLIYAQGLGGIAFTAATGLDWHLGTFSASFIKDAHFNLLGNGEFEMAKITDPATAPGAAIIKITAEAGTTGGTCKLVVRAGTSATATTLLDNIGTGC